MRLRGEKYWSWVDPQLHTRTHQEELPDGSSLDVEVRLSRTGGTQMFIGLYAKGGLALTEEIYDFLPGQTMTRALLWGAQRARDLSAKPEVAQRALLLAT